MPGCAQPLIKIRNVSKWFKTNAGLLRACHAIDLDIYPGETVGIAGESGCGKSTLGKLAIRLESPSQGEIIFEGTNIANLSHKTLRPLRRHMQMVFQNPYHSLNPKMSIGEIIGTALDIHQLRQGSARTRRIKELLEMVQLSPLQVQSWPSQLSGGQRQRVGIARALAVEPKFIVFDEPLSALDAITQWQIADLLKQLQRDLHIAYLFIGHDLSIMSSLAHRIAVMYLGEIVEIAPSQILCQNPQHPYTKALLSSVPIPDPDLTQKRTRLFLKEEIPSPLTPPTGCSFHTRCPFATEKCKQHKPIKKEVSPGHLVACHLV